MSIISKIGQSVADTFCPNKIVQTSKDARSRVGEKTAKLANGFSYFKGAEALLPVILVETFVTSGRTYQAHKRGGANEARERFIEQGTSAVVWIFGVSAFNKIGDFIGKKLGLKDIETDVGSDEVRNPFKNLVKDKKFATSIFKFGKIASSVLLATGIVGWVIPKINIAVTNKKLKEKRERENALVAKDFVNFDEFSNKTKKKDVQFKGLMSADSIRTLTDAFENNTKFKLISQDAGIIVGRTTNARNKYEALEYLFRDSVSIYFYMFCGANILFLLNKLTKNVDIHPQSAIETAGLLMKNMEKHKSLAPDEFKKLALSPLDDETMKKIDTLFVDKSKKVVTLDEFTTFMGDKMTSEIDDRARKMALLQPAREDGAKILTKMQINDILSTKWTSDPEFLRQALDEATNGKATNPKKFIKYTELEGIRKSFDKFVDNMAKSAQKAGKNIDDEFIKNYVKKNVFKNSIYTACGIIFSGIMLALVIPKLQCLITEKASGKNSFPGVTTY